MNRLALVVVLVVVALLGTWQGVASRATGQADASPTAGAVSDPVTAGDWTFQVLEVERLESYYAERAARVERPEGVFLIVGMAITYNGTSTNALDHFVPPNFFEITTASGQIYAQSDIFAVFAVEESYRTDAPYPPLPGNGVAEPGVTHYVRYIYDVPVDATGLSHAAGPLAPTEFSIPLPDPTDIAAEAEWEVEALAARLHETLGPPYTANSHTPEEIFLVVDVRLTRLRDDPAAIDAYWFFLRTDAGDTFDIALEPTLDSGVPFGTDDRESWEFGLVFDVPTSVSNVTLVSIPSAPISIEIPLDPTVAPTPTPTPSPTATSTPAPTPEPSPPAPGAIRVVTSDGGASVPENAAGAVELILDTSGSMLQPMGAGLRIDVARDVLTDVVSSQLPPGTLTALRVFGTVPGSCETSLVIPLGPLDPEAAVPIVANLQAVDEVRTPLGASLQAAGIDLAAVDGPKLIVLVTDGEETCDGDAEAVIAALAAQGIDIRINIVGFAIDDPEIERTLATWAEQGGGQYLSAADAEDLGPALNRALQPAFDVYDSDGALIGSGVVNGEPVPAPAGRYTVVVSTDPPVTIESAVEPGQTTEIVLEEGG